MGRVRPPPHPLPPSSQSVSFPTAEILQKSKLQTDKKLRGEAGELSEPLSSSTEVFEVDSKNKKGESEAVDFFNKNKKNQLLYSHLHLKNEAPDNKTASSRAPVLQHQFQETFTSQPSARRGRLLAQTGSGPQWSFSPNRSLLNTSPDRPSPSACSSLPVQPLPSGAAPEPFSDTASGSCLPVQKKKRKPLVSGREACRGKPERSSQRDGGWTGVAPSRGLLFCRLWGRLNSHSHVTK